ncbi:MAG: hypothetical protein B5766_01880 [Candidatus Lumbricidophila eiseniae]|uniref:Uncharacterized protein n=1 Tax=Candidatus Lumbricidiphila eiseniae TaxID=1969409 RepID=A0A2A6FU97_9MICO|nr:MAG: hypothetical protein B5766_01880 [Candidatus Lumbricidophila eiseniae]
MGVGFSGWRGLELAVHQARHEQEGRPVFDDLVTRLFTVGAPNWLWLTDLREHWERVKWCV